MEPLNRRAFITRSGAVVAAAGAAVLIPGQLVGAATRAPAHPAGSGSLATSTSSPIDGDLELTEPVIAHVRNISSGEIAIYSGSRETVVNNRELAALLARSAGGRS